MIDPIFDLRRRLTDIERPKPEKPKNGQQLSEEPNNGQQLREEPNNGQQLSEEPIALTNHPQSSRQSSTDGQPKWIKLWRSEKSNDIIDKSQTFTREPNESPPIIAPNIRRITKAASISLITREWDMWKLSEPGFEFALDNKECRKLEHSIGNHKWFENMNNTVIMFGKGDVYELHGFNARDKDDVMKTVYHATNNNGKFTQEKQYRQEDPFKPNGLWYTLEEGAWIKMANDLMRRKHKREIEVRVDLSDVYLLTDLDAVKELNKTSNIPPDDYGNEIPFPNWDLLASQFKGFEIRLDEDQWKTVKNPKNTQYLWVDAFDLNSGVIWDLTAVQEFIEPELSEMDIFKKAAEVTTKSLRDKERKERKKETIPVKASKVYKELKECPLLTTDPDSVTRKIGDSKVIFLPHGGAYFHRVLQKLGNPDLILKYENDSDLMNTDVDLMIYYEGNLEEVKAGVLNCLDVEETDIEASLYGSTSYSQVVKYYGTALDLSFEDGFPLSRYIEARGYGKAKLTDFILFDTLALLSEKYEYVCKEWFGNDIRLLDPMKVYKMLVRALYVLKHFESEKINFEEIMEDLAPLKKFDLNNSDYDRIRTFRQMVNVMTIFRNSESRELQDFKKILLDARVYSNSMLMANQLAFDSGMNGVRFSVGQEYEKVFFGENKEYFTIYIFCNATNNDMAKIEMEVIDGNKLHFAYSQTYEIYQAMGWNSLLRILVLWWWKEDSPADKAVSSAASPLTIYSLSKLGFNVNDPRRDPDGKLQETIVNLKDESSETWIEVLTSQFGMQDKELFGTQEWGNIYKMTMEKSSLQNIGLQQLFVDALNKSYSKNLQKEDKPCELSIAGGGNDFNSNVVGMITGLFVMTVAAFVQF